MRTVIEQLPELVHVTVDNADSKIYFIIYNVEFSLYERAVFIKCEQYTQLKNADGTIRDTSMVPRTYRVDNFTYAVPRVNAQGQPVADENGEPTAIGNYDFIYRMLQKFDFDQMLLGAVVARVENTENPMVWVQQP